MSDDKTKKHIDGMRISLKEDYEVRYWMERFDVTQEQLEKAVKEKGHSVKNVEAYLLTNSNTDLA